MTRSPGLLVLVVLGALAVGFSSQSSAQPGPEPTRVVILGVNHSAQLVVESQRPAVFRAFFERVQPDAIAVERDPDSFARQDPYEFTYEIQYLAVPWAREHGVPVYPFDWIPPVSDARLLFGVDLNEPPFVRRSQGFGGFYALADSSILSKPVLYADAEGAGDEALAWADTPQARASPEAARRLFLYRTFLQARRVALAASDVPGGTLLVLVGHMHKPDFERILADDPSLELVPASSYGVPADAAVSSHERTEDAYAVASFNILGVQHRTGVVDLPYVRGAVRRITEESGEAPEARLLQTRLAVLEDGLEPAEAARRYRQVRETVGPNVAFTWTGVKDPARLDSYFDPFGNLTVEQRAAVEEARELYKSGRAVETDALREQIAAGLTRAKAVQLRAYWEEHVQQAP